MVDVIASAVVFVVVLGILLAVPRYTGTGGAGTSNADTWPDLLGGLDRKVTWWLGQSRGWDIALGIVTVVLLAVAITVYQDPAILAGLESFAPFVYNTIAILGLVGLFATTHIRIRRAGLHPAEATFIGAILVGLVLILLASGLLLQ